MDGLPKDRTLVMIYVIASSLESGWKTTLGDHCNKELCSNTFQVFKSCLVDKVTLYSDFYVDLLASVSSKTHPMGIIVSLYKPFAPDKRTFPFLPSIPYISIHNFCIRYSTLFQKLSGISSAYFNFICSSRTKR